MKTKDKKIEMSKKMLVAEHSRIVPELRKAGLKKEADEQSEELNKLKKE